MSKQQDPLPLGGAQSAPTYRIGDLVWCQEVRNNKLWWPAMVTYDPHLGIFYRTTKQKCMQYHVQYFGISAIRGWVSLKSCVPLVSPEEKLFSEKGLSKKVKSEYEVAIQEVSEACKLDHKQRKLKFIFSFGPSSRKKSKQKSHHTKEVSKAPPIKVEPKDDSDTDSECHVRGDGDTATPRDSKLGAGSTKRQSSGSNETGGGGGGGGKAPPLRSSGRVKARAAAAASDTKPSQAAATALDTSHSTGKKSRHNSTTRDPPPSSSKAKKLSLPTNGQWGTSGKPAARTAEVPISPLCLHSQHSSSSSKPARRKSSDSSHQDCDRCTSYINGSEATELTCNSDPEVFEDAGLERDVEPILMYVQKQYEGSNKSSLTPTEPNPPPNLNRDAPLTRGMSTRNLSTSSTGGTSVAAKQSRAHSKAQEQARKTGSSSSPSPVLSGSQSSSTNGSISSESGYETGKSLLLQQQQSALSNRKRKRTNRSCSSLSSAVSPLTETQQAKEGEAAVPAVVGELAGRRKRTRNLSTCSAQANMFVERDARCGREEGGDGDAASPKGKRVRRSSARHPPELPPATTTTNTTTTHTAKRSRRHSAPQHNKPLPDHTHPLIAGSNDSGNESSTAGQPTPCPTPTLSSSTEDAPSTSNIKRENSTPEPSTGTSARAHATMAAAKEKKKPSKQVSETDSKPSGVCSICDCEGTDLICAGHCMSAFHLDCLGLVEEPAFKFLCDECLISSGTCFQCGKAQGDVRKCAKPKCTKLYHRECARGNPLFQGGNKSSSSFTCPLHVCARCTSIGVSSVSHSNLVQCVRCPLALHKPDCLVAGCEVIDQTRMLCYRHLKISRNTNLYSHININTCLECGGLGSLYCCDVCSAAYHSECLDPDSRPSSDSSHWKCPSCTVHDLPTYGSLVITKFGVWR